MRVQAVGGGGERGDGGGAGLKVIGDMESLKARREDPGAGTGGRVWEGDVITPDLCLFGAMA